MLTKKDLVFRAAASLILVAAIGYSFAPQIASWIMAFSVAIFSFTIATTPYNGKNVRGKRLHAFRMLACMCFAGATYLMFIQNNNWVLATLVGTVFLVYGTVVLTKLINEENREG